MSWRCLAAPGLGGEVAGGRWGRGRQPGKERHRVRDADGAGVAERSLTGVKGHCEEGWEIKWKR